MRERINVLKMKKHKIVTASGWNEAGKLLQHQLIRFSVKPLKEVKLKMREYSASER